jgi:hypothetical protein
MVQNKKVTKDRNLLFGVPFWQTATWLSSKKTPQHMVYAKMEFALSIKTDSDQNHNPALQALNFRKVRF